MAEVETHWDVVVIGAGISGISAAWHLQTMCPDREFTILEGRANLGGTWDLFRYPGIRSDSDMHTLGFAFKPWAADKAIADGPAIMEYLNEAVDEFDIRRRIQFDHHVHAASWSSESKQWTLSITAEGVDKTITAGFVLMCTGYYSYKGGYRPDFPGEDTFTGPILHPQEWPDDLDYVGKRIVVIGSGATAVTLVPAMADSGAGHVMMLQRSPTWMVAAPAKDPIANVLRKVLPADRAYRLTRAKNVNLTDKVYKRSRTHPEKVAKALRKRLRKHFTEDQIDEFFTPQYDPWDQRLCLVPDADLFNTMKTGKAEIVNGTIDSFTESGIQLSSGEHLDADIIVTATGLNLVTIGEMDFDVDGEIVDFSQRWSYKGFSYSDMPNLLSTFGYINASWTLRADLVSAYACRILNHMAESGTTTATPVLRPSDADMPRRPWVDDFSAGYMARMMPLLPKQGDREPWINTQDYKADRELIGEAPVDDGVMNFA
ncbi:MAG: NAD(P)/FAD-dependent oxidoreductase [Acidimicrobiales bacterium]|nr:NAD(P)/FAD-dependent oxidoreductase [Acidimicrobiales bacterium]